MAEQRYYVIGGEYADTSFTTPATGTALETHGPFGEREAKQFWQSVTGKTVDNAMVRYFLKPEDQIVGKIYWVVGGEYADSEFTRLAPGRELEVFGPFEKWEALGFWRGLTSKSVDDALIRYDIRKNYRREDAQRPAAVSKGPKVRTKTKSCAIAAAPEKVIAYLGDVIHWPEWATHNIAAVTSRADGGWDVTTPTGPGRLSVTFDAGRGLFDHVFDDAAGHRWAVPSRVISGGGGAIVIMTFIKPPGVSESDFASGMSQVDDELATLRGILEG